MRITLALTLILIAGMSEELGLAQHRSGATAVSLVATVQESFAVRCLQIPAVQSFAKESQATPPALHVVLNWHLRTSSNFVLKAEMVGKTDSPSLLASPRFVSLSRLGQAPRAFSFLPSRHDQPGLLATWGDTEDKPSGTAGLLVALPPPDGSEQAVTISVAVF